MADAPTKTFVVQVPARQAAAESLAEEMKELAKHPLDQTEPGGRYLHTDGKTLLDAEGFKLNAKGKRLPGQTTPVVAGGVVPDEDEGTDEDTDEDEEEEETEEETTTVRQPARRKAAARRR